MASNANTTVYKNILWLDISVSYIQDLQFLNILHINITFPASNN